MSREQFLDTRGTVQYNLGTSVKLESLSSESSLHVKKHDNNSLINYILRQFLLP